MAEVLTNEWTAVRVVSLPLVADPDWRATNDIAGIKAAAGLFTIIPKANTSGSFQIGVLYLDADDDLVVPGNNSRVTIELLQLTEIKPRPSIGLTARVVSMRTGEDIILRGEQIITGETIGKFKQDIAARVVSTQSEPIGATSVVIVSRFA